MVILDKTIRIRAPPERVFAELTSLSRAARWHVGTIRALPSTPGAPLEAGAGFALVEEALGERWRCEARAVAVEPGRRFAWRQERGDYARHEGDYVLEPEEGGRVTRVRYRLHLELPFVLPRLVRADEVGRALSAREDRSLLALKDACERR